MKHLKKQVLALGRSMGLCGLGRLLSARSFVILMFHGLTDRVHSGLENCDGKHLPVDLFAGFLDYLGRRHRVEKLEDVLDSLDRGVSPMAGTVVLTFDDGYRSNYRLAYPELKKRGMPASVYPATGFVAGDEPLWTDRLEFALGRSGLDSLEVGHAGNSVVFDLGSMEAREAALKTMKLQMKAMPMGAMFQKVAELEERLGISLCGCEECPDIYRALDWSEIREMVESGLVSIGAHTHGHRILGKCSAGEAEQEVRVCRDLIRENTGVEPRLFCYPNGKAGDFNADTVRLLQGNGFRCGLTTEPGRNTVSSDPYGLKRIGVSAEWDQAYFELSVSGALAVLKGNR